MWAVLTFTRSKQFVQFSLYSFTKLLQYMERQWFNNIVFDVPSWSVYQHYVRTNNDTECYTTGTWIYIRKHPDSIYMTFPNIYLYNKLKECNEIVPHPLIRYKNFPASTWSFPWSGILNKLKSIFCNRSSSLIAHLDTAIKHFCYF